MNHQLARRGLRDPGHLAEIDAPERIRLILTVSTVGWIVGFPLFVLAVPDIDAPALLIYAWGGFISPLTYVHATRIQRFPAWFAIAVMLWVMSLAVADEFYVIAAPAIVVAVYAGASAVLGPRFALAGGLTVVAGSAITNWAAGVDDPVDRVFAVAMAVFAAGFFTGNIAALARGLRMELSDALASAEWEATHDSLTGLANRRLLLRRLESVASDRRVNPSQVWFAVFDLDGFKGVNDAFGHAAGDRVLTETARRLRAHARDSDLAVRIGGDEFAVVFVGLGEAALGAVLDRLQRSIALPVELPELPDEPDLPEQPEREAAGSGRTAEPIGVSLAVSVGVASLAEASTVDAVIRLADERMYAAKRLARNTSA